MLNSVNIFGSVRYSPYLCIMIELNKRISDWSILIERMSIVDRISIIEQQIDEILGKYEQTL